MELEALESIFNLYKSRYLRIFEKIYPARNSTGFPERNLSVNFTKAYETYYSNCDVISWFELQFGENDNYHLDAVVANYTTKEIFFVEAKRFSNPAKKKEEIKEDIVRIHKLKEELLKECDCNSARIDLKMFNSIYGVVLADLWTENDTKKEILTQYLDNNFVQKGLKFNDDLGEIIYSVQSFKDGCSKNVAQCIQDNYNLCSVVWLLKNKGYSTTFTTVNSKLL